MRSKIVILLLLSVVVCFVTANNDVEARGKKKKKLALFVYFADIVIKKIFVLKLIYAFVFWVVIHKAGYFLAWFVSFLKEQKSHDHHHDHHDHHYDHHDYYNRLDTNKKKPYDPYGQSQYSYSTINK